MGGKGAEEIGPVGTASTGSWLMGAGAAAALRIGEPPMRADEHAPSARTVQRVAARA
jgi:hypothetical protein